MNRKIFLQAGLIALGAALGILAALSLAHVIQLELGRAALDSYARRLQKSGLQLASEADAATIAVGDANLPFCSNAEIALMRNFTYRSEDVKEIERVRDGKIYCTAGLGQLSQPVPMPAPSLSLPGMNIYAFAGLPFATNGQAFIVERLGTAVILNPDAFKNLDEPPLLYSGLLFDRENMRVLRGFGHSMPLSNAEIVQGAFIERNGVFYRAQCAPHGMVCVVAAESRADMLARSHWLSAGLLAGGAAAGAACVLILILFYRRQQTLERQLRRALRRGDLTLVYQPVIDLETRAIVGAEALVRWINDAGENIRPDIFVAVAEDRGFVSQLTRLVMNRAIEELGDVLATGNFRITLNISSQDLASPAFFAQLKQCMVLAKIAPSVVGLELTERSTADHKVAINAINQLSQAGHAVYIDDFGTGYSSLAYLHQLAVSAIKIDRAFTKTIGTESVTSSVVPQILEMAAKLNLKVVVEGIETEEQAEYFRNAGSGILGQGWLFGRPAPAAMFRTRFAASAPSAPPALRPTA